MLPALLKLAPLPPPSSQFSASVDYGSTSVSRISSSSQVRLAGRVRVRWLLPTQACWAASSPEGMAGPQAEPTA